MRLFDARLGPLLLVLLLLLLLAPGPLTVPTFAPFPAEGDVPARAAAAGMGEER
jgi:hypothetical protein